MKKSLLTELKAAFSIHTFVETGTYLGYTTSEAAQIFKKVCTIELSNEIHLLAKENLKSYKNVSLYQGNSGDVLNNLLPLIPSRTLFYLDGHYSGGATAKGFENTPVLDELEAIKNSGKSDSVILIDDIQLFQDSCHPEKILNTCLEGYPNFDQLVAALLQINPDYRICFLSDTLLAYPKDSLISVSPAVNACTLHRFENFCDLSDDVLQKADQAIANVSGVEQEEFALFFQIFASGEQEYGYPCFATFWQALIFRIHGERQQALFLFKQAAQNSPSNCRINKFQN